MSSTDRIRYRVAGATVILLSLMVAWFLLRQMDQQDPLQTSVSEMPEHLKVSTFEVPEATNPATETQGSDKLPETKARQVRPDEKVKPDDSRKAATTDKPSKTALVDMGHEGQAIAFVIQVASFSDRKNAQGLLKKMLEQGYPAYVKVFTVKGKQTFRVLVGPKFDKTVAKRLEREIAAKYKLKTLLLKFRPGFAQ